MARYALLVGIDQYENNAIPPLHFAERDTEVLEQVLVDCGGFQTHRLTGSQATRERILDVISGKAAEIGWPAFTDKDQVLFFFSGHGQLVGGQYVLHAYRAQSGTGTHSVYVHDLAHILKLSIPCEECVCIIDACRNLAAPGARGAVGTGLDSQSKRDIEKLASGGNDAKLVEVLYGCDEGQTSLEDPALQQGILTYHLAKALREGGHTTIEDATDEAGDQMREWFQRHHPDCVQKPYLHRPPTKRRIVLFDHAPDVESLPQDMSQEVDRVKQSMAQGDFKSAADLLNILTQRSPHSYRLKQLRRQIDEGRRKAEAKKLAQQRRGLEQRVATLLADAEKFLAEGDLESAIGCAAEAVRLQPNGPARALLERLEQLLRTGPAEIVSPPRLRVVTVPPGATVEVDGYASGASPVELVLDPGKHHLRATCAGFRAGSQWIHFAGENDEELAMRLDPLPRLHVETDPGGAEIEIDGQARGKSPIEVSLEQGRHQIGAKLVGFKTTDRWIEFTGEGDEQLQLRLEPEPRVAEITSKRLGQRVALIAGVEKYEDANIGDLTCVNSDCTQLDGLLRLLAKFDDVRLLLGAGSKKILDAAYEMAGKLNPGDLFLFYFSGHGKQHEKQHLLLCGEAKLSRLKYMQDVVPVDLLRDETEREGVNRILILDACRSDLRSESRRGAESIGLVGEQQLRDIVGSWSADSKQGSLGILCSCSEGQQATEILSINHGLFTAALIESMKDALQMGRSVRLSDEWREELTERMHRLALAHGLPPNQRPFIRWEGAELPVILHEVGLRAAPMDLRGSAPQ